MRLTGPCRHLVPRSWSSLILALLINASVLPALLLSSLVVPSTEVSFSQPSLEQFGLGAPLFVKTAYADDEPIFSDDQCFAVADEPGKLDTLIEVDLVAGLTKEIGDVEITGQMEAIAVVPDPVIEGQAIIYAANAHIFGKLLVRGYGTEEARVFWQPVGAFGRATGSANGVTLSDVDGLTYDIKNDIMYGVHRRNQGKPDLLFILDRNNGHFIPNHFNTEDGPADYVTVDVIDGLHDVDDIAIHPETREMFGIINDNGRGGILVQLDPTTGHITQSYTIRDATGQIVDDLEGLAFTSKSELYGSSGEHGPDKDDKNKLFWIDLSTRDDINNVVRATARALFDKGADDVEGLGCLTTLPGEPAIDVEKSTNGEDADEPGSGPEILMSCPVVWDYTVTNTGEVDLSNVQLADDQIGPISCPLAELPVGESMVCSVEGLAIASEYANLASVTADSSRGPVADTDPSHYSGIATSIVLEKATNGEDADEAPGPIIPEGEPVTWTYVVTNTSTVPLQNVVVTDDQLADEAISCPADQLAPGESMACTASGVAQAGQYANVGTVTAMPVNGCLPVTDSDPSHYFGAVPGLTLEKFTNGFDADLPEDGPELAVSCDVLWTYEITNTGNIQLESLALTDDQIGDISCPADSLAVGESMTCSVPGTAEEGQYANLGTVTAIPTGSSTSLMATDPSHYNGLLAAVDIEKSTSADGVEPVDADEAPGPSIASGSEVTWLYTVANTGSMDLTDVTVVDDQVADVQCPQSTLAVGESVVCSATGTAVSGQYANTATVIATAVLSDGLNACSPVTDSDPSHYFGILPDLDIAQTVVVDWSYNVTNTGQITLVNVLVDGGEDVEISCPMDRLELGQAMTCSASGPQERFGNDATVTAFPEDRNIQLTRKIQATPITGLTVSASVGEAIAEAEPRSLSLFGSEAQLPVGAEAVWRYLVENQGTFAVENITGRATDLLSREVTDLKCEETTLAPGETTLCMANDFAALGRNGWLGSFEGNVSDTEQPVAADAVAFYSGVEPATVGGRIFVDAVSVVGAANGRQDPGELNLGPVASNLTIELYRFDGVKIDERVPADDGTYEFTGLLPDDYYIVVHRPDAAADAIQGFSWAAPNQSNNRLDSDVNVDWHTGRNSAQTEFFRLDSGEVDRSWDIGFQEVPLFGHIYIDANENGERDDGEEGIPSVKIYLTNLLLSGAEVIVRTTNGAGIFEYGNLNPSHYKVLVELPDEYIDDPLGGTAPDTDPTDGINLRVKRNTATFIFLPILTASDAEGGK